MQKILSNSKSSLSVAIFSMLLGLALGAFFHKETIVVRGGTADTPAAMSSVNLMIDDGQGLVRTWNTISWHETMSAVNLLEMVHGANEITLVTDTDEMGSVVRSINDVGGTSGDDMRWQFWVNNIYEPREASRYFLKPGDIVLWKYAKEQPK